MAVTNQKIRLIGQILTPIVTRRTVFYIKGCKVVVSKGTRENERGYFPYPIKRSFTKLIKGKREAPESKRCYQGFVIVDFPGEKKQAEKRLNWFFSLKALGAYQQEGMGKIHWLERQKITPRKRLAKKKFRIRKGLGAYPEKVLLIVRALLLHDFVHTTKHLSKIYQEVNITYPFLRDACKNHHQKECSNWLIKTITKYDCMAARITRKNPYKVLARYDYEQHVIDFKKLANEIEQRQESAHQLYHYIYHSKELELIPEALAYGKNNLKRHLLLSVNLFINEFKKQTKQKLNHNKLSETKKEETKRFLSTTLLLRGSNPSKKGFSIEKKRLQVTDCQGESNRFKGRRDGACEGRPKKMK